MEEFINALSNTIFHNFDKIAQTLYNYGQIGFLLNKEKMTLELSYNSNPSEFTYIKYDICFDNNLELYLKMQNKRIKKF